VYFSSAPRAVPVSSESVRRQVGQVNSERGIWRSHQELPRLLRLQWIVPLTCILVFIGGRFFALPPGPLCDEGMVLFMEGGCDFGATNVYFFSKLGLLISLNLAFVVAWLAGVRSFLGFAPHFVVALGLATVTWSGGLCDTYYSQPNGSIGQTVLEAAAFAILGIAMLMRLQKGSVLRLVLALLACNLLNVLYFYLWLALFPHWAWLHTAAVILSLVVTAGMLSPDNSLNRAPHRASRNQ